MRGRAVLVAGTAIAVFGVLVGVSAYLVVTQSATASLAATVDARVGEVLDQLGEQAASDPSSVDLEPLIGLNPTYLQVVTPAGVVLATTPGLGAGEGICPQPLATTPSRDTVTLSVDGADSAFLRTTTPASVPVGDVVICAAASDEPVRRAQAAVLLTLLVSLPLLVLSVCVVVWLAVGRALGAVEDLRSQADAMRSTSDGLLRVPETADEVEYLGHTLNTLLGHLHHQSRATRQFVADAGHELRNPLSTLRVTLEFGLDADDAALRASVGEALGDLDRLEALTRDLLTLARSDGMQQVADFELVDLRDVVADVVAAARRARPDLAIGLSADSCVVRGDQAALRSLVTNLVGNASRHSRFTVSVTLGRSGSLARLSVDDDGDGLLPEDCDRVFERFVRLDESRDRDEGGSGLGLAIVAATAEAHDGRAMARPGPGGHFAVTLPLADAGSVPPRA